MYLTSFRGVRSTFEECRYVKTVLHNLRVKVEERDIYMNKHFYKEMDDRLEEYGVSKLAVPQVFISGQHIGVSILLNILYIIWNFCAVCKTRFIGIHVPR